jgi:hypothetical protein
LLFRMCLYGSWMNIGDRSLIKCMDKGIVRSIPLHSALCWTLNAEVQLNLIFRPIIDVINAIVQVDFRLEWIFTMFHPIFNNLNV